MLHQIQSIVAHVSLAHKTYKTIYITCHTSCNMVTCTMKYDIDQSTNNSTNSLAQQLIAHKFYIVNCGIGSLWRCERQKMHYKNLDLLTYQHPSHTIHTLKQNSRTNCTYHISDMQQSHRLTMAVIAMKLVRFRQHCHVQRCFARVNNNSSKHFFSHATATNVQHHKKQNIQNSEFDVYQGF